MCTAVGDAESGFLLGGLARVMLLLHVIKPWDLQKRRRPGPYTVSVVLPVRMTSAHSLLLLATRDVDAIAGPGASSVDGLSGLVWIQAKRRNRSAWLLVSGVSCCRRRRNDKWRTVAPILAFPAVVLADFPFVKVLPVRSGPVHRQHVGRSLVSPPCYPLGTEEEEEEEEEDGRTMR